MTLRARVVLILVVLTVIGVSGAAFATYRISDQELKGSVDRFLERRAEEITDGSRPTPGRDNDGRGRDRGRGGGDTDLTLTVDADALVQTIDRQGEVTAFSDLVLPVGDADLRVARDTDAKDVFRTVVIGGVEHRMLTVPLEVGGALQIATESESITDVLGSLRGRLLILGVVIAAASVVLGWFLMRRATRPLAQLTTAAERVATEQDLTPIGISGDDEVGRLAHSFDKMLVALGTSREQQRRLVQDAGHELRTPLTSLRANLELLQRVDNIPEDDRRAMLASMVDETEELGLLFDEVLQLASGDAGNGEPESDLDLVEIVREAAARLERRSDRTVTVQTFAGERLDVTGMRSLLERAVTNLLSNAAKFSPAATPITASVGRSSAGDVVVAVSDRGPGIQPDELDRIFDRFYRSDATRTAPGSGLGLAIVRQVADQHHGRAFARNLPDGGAEVGFTIGQAR